MPGRRNAYSLEASSDAGACGSRWQRTPNTLQQLQLIRNARLFPERKAELCGLRRCKYWKAECLGSRLGRQTKELRSVGDELYDQRPLFGLRCCKRWNVECLGNRFGRPTKELRSVDGLYDQRPLPGRS